MIHGTDDSHCDARGRADDTIVLRRTPGDDRVIGIVDAYAVVGVDHDVVMPQSVHAAVETASPTLLVFAEGSLVGLRAVVFRGDIAGCECVVRGRTTVLRGVGTIFVVETDTVSSPRPRIPGVPTEARYVRVRRDDRERDPVSLAAVHVRSTDYAEPWPVSARVIPVDAPEAEMRRLLDYSDYTFLTTPSERGVAVELDYGQTVAVYALTLLTRPSISGCFVEPSALPANQNKNNRSGRMPAVRCAHCSTRIDPLFSVARSEAAALCKSSRPFANIRTNVTPRRDRRKTTPRAVCRLSKAGGARFSSS